MSIFVSKDDEFSVDIVVGTSKIKKDYVYCDVSSEKLKEVSLDGGVVDVENEETHTIWFRMPNYGDSTRILDKSVRVEDESLKISPSELRKVRVSTLIKRWTFKDAEGKIIPANATTLDTLHPLVAAVITYQLEEELRNRGLI